MEIRLAIASEHVAIAELTLRAYVDAGFVDEDDAYVSQLRDVPRRAGEAEVWVAADGDDLLGAVTWCPDGSTWRELATEDEGEFRMLAVDPAARGRGVGAALVHHCLGLSRAAGHRGMVLSTLTAMHDAHRLYERLGFRRAPGRDWSPVPGVDLLAFDLRY